MKTLSKPEPITTKTDAKLVEYPWIGGRVPNGYWDFREHRVLYMEWLGRECGFVTPEDWYAVRKHHFQRYRGGGLLRNRFGCSVVAALRDYMPQMDWKPWLFGGAPNGFWSNRKNRVLFMDWMGEQLGCREPEDWYAVTGADFFLYHGGGLLNNQFKGSVQAVLQDYLPDFDWKAWKFPSVPQSYWRSPDNRRSYMKWLGSELGFKSDQDWRRLSRDDFYRLHGSGLFVSQYGGSTQRALTEWFAGS